MIDTLRRGMRSSIRIACALAALSSIPRAAAGTSGGAGGDLHWRSPEPPGATADTPPATPADSALPARPDARFRLAWVRGSGADACPDAPRIARDVSTRLGHDPFSPDADRSIEAVVARELGMLVIRIFVRGPAGQPAGDREISTAAPDCEALADAAALAIALVIDPAARMAPAATLPPPPEPTIPPPPVPSPGLRPRSRSWSEAPGVGARGLMARGALPGAALGAALAIDGPSPGRIAWSAGAMFLPETALASGEIGFGLTSGWLGACVDPARRDRLVLTACAHAHLGVVHAFVLDTTAVEPGEPGDLLWAAGEVALRVRLAIAGSFSLETGAQGLVPLVRHRFTLGPREVFRQDPVIAAVFVGLGLRFR